MIGIDTVQIHVRIEAIRVDSLRRHIDSNLTLISQARDTCITSYIANMIDYNYS